MDPAGPSDDAVDRVSASPVRVALLRTAIVTAATGLLTTVVVAVILGRWRGEEALIFSIFSAGVALASAPAAWLELRSTLGGPVGWPRALALAHAAVGVSFVMAVLAILQVLYARAALAGDMDQGMRDAVNALERLARWETVRALLPLGVPIGLTTLARALALRPGVHLGLSLVVGVGLACYCELLLGGSHVERALFGAVGFVLAAVLPPAAWLADRLDRRRWPPPPG